MAQLRERRDRPQDTALERGQSVVLLKPRKTILHTQSRLYNIDPLVSLLAHVQLTPKIPHPYLFVNDSNHYPDEEPLITDHSHNVTESFFQKIDIEAFLRQQTRQIDLTKNPVIQLVVTSTSGKEFLRRWSCTPDWLIVEQYRKLFQDVVWSGECILPNTKKYVVSTQFPTYESFIAGSGAYTAHKTYHYANRADQIQRLMVIGSIEAHRLVAMVTCGFIAEGYDASHLCGKRGCINPLHLFMELKAINLSRFRCHLIQTHNMHLTCPHSPKCKYCPHIDLGRLVQNVDQHKFKFATKESKTNSPAVMGLIRGGAPILQVVKDEHNLHRRLSNARMASLVARTGWTDRDVYAYICKMRDGRLQYI